MKKRVIEERFLKEMQEIEEIIGKKFKRVYGDEDKTAWDANLQGEEEQIRLTYILGGTWRCDFLRGGYAAWGNNMGTEAKSPLAAFRGMRRDMERGILEIKVYLSKVGYAPPTTCYKCKGPVEIVRGKLKEHTASSVCDNEIPGVHSTEVCAGSGKAPRG
jgi:hypothetical protein